VTAPACAPLGGCLGDRACDYCGTPMPAPTAARQRLAELIDVIVEDISRTQQVAP